MEVQSDFAKRLADIIEREKRVLLNKLEKDIDIPTSFLRYLRQFRAIIDIENNIKDMVSPNGDKRD